MAQHRCTVPQKRGHVESLRLLIEAGAEKDERDEGPEGMMPLHGATPLFVAAEERPSWCHSSSDGSWCPQRSSHELWHNATVHRSTSTAILMSFVI